MASAAAGYLRKVGFTRVCIALAPGWDAITGFDEYIDADGWFYDQRRSVSARLIRRLGEFSHSFMIAADCLDGSYNPGSISRRLDILEEHLAAGGEARLINASFRKQALPLAVERLRALDPRIGIYARDPHSAERLRQATDRPISETTDLAFLVESDREEGHDLSGLQFIARSNAAGRPVIGLNVNFLIEKMHPGFGLAHVELIEALLRADYSILLLPHDSRGNPSDADLLRDLRERFPKAIDRFFFQDFLPPPLEQMVLRGLHCLITSRMHAAILAMGAMTPSIGFTYSDKFEGIYRLAGLDHSRLLFDPAELVNDPAGMGALLVGRLPEMNSHRRVLERSLPSLRAKAAENFAGITPAVPADASRSLEVA